MCLTLCEQLKRKTKMKTIIKYKKKRNRSENGDNFVVKNVEQFASTVLPQYFKHSNFSSFARQLNFYGFRKLKAEPILTADFDARTASYVRFYHEKFQRNKPELLGHIKRATKSDAQAKDDVDGLRNEIGVLKDSIFTMREQFDQKLATMAFEFNRKIATLSAEYDRLATSMQRPVVPPLHATAISVDSALQASSQQTTTHHHHPQQQQQQFRSSLCSSTSMMQSLTHVAGVKLHSPSVSSQSALDRPAPPPLLMGSSSVTHTLNVGDKRPAEDELHNSNHRTRF